MYTDGSVLGFHFYKKIILKKIYVKLKMYSVGPSQKYTRYLPVNFGAAVTNIFEMRLTC